MKNKQLQSLTRRALGTVAVASLCLAPAFSQAETAESTLVVGGALNLRQTASLEAKVLGHTSEYAFAVTEQTINTSILHVSMLRPASGLSEEEKQLAVRYLADSVLQHIDEVQALE